MTDSHLRTCDEKQKEVKRILHNIEELDSQYYEIFVKKARVLSDALEKLRDDEMRLKRVIQEIKSLNNNTSVSENGGDEESGAIKKIKSKRDYDDDDEGIRRLQQALLDGDTDDDENSSNSSIAVNDIPAKSVVPRYDFEDIKERPRIGINVSDDVHDQLPFIPKAEKDDTISISTSKFENQFANEI